MMEKKKKKKKRSKRARKTWSQNLKSETALFSANKMQRIWMKTYETTRTK